MSVTFKISSGGAGRAVCDRDAQRVQVARRLTAARLQYCALDELVDDASLVVSELVTNAIKHSGGTEITFTMIVGDRQLQLFVHDEMQGCPHLCTSGDDAESGRGLFLVDCIAHARGGRWGISDAGATTWCWFSLTRAQP
ncbi:ATP-binding protein [Streptomyces sp. NPDC002580]|uniref:ATP-binding protein n=1 Tax=Streptomyces sp. NPDC002580 TaxID=3364653 RepID=UPI0036C91F98